MKKRVMYFFVFVSLLSLIAAPIAVFADPPDTDEEDSEETNNDENTESTESDTGSSGKVNPSDEDWTGWDDEENQEVCMAVFSTTEWMDLFNDGERVFLYSSGDGIVYADVSDGFREKVLRTDVFVDEDDELATPRTEQILLEDYVYSNTKNEDEAELIIAVVYTLYKKGYKLGSGALKNNDYACSNIFLPTVDRDAEDGTESIDDVIKIWESCISSYNNAYTVPLTYYDRDKLAKAIQGIIYGSGYAASSGSYSESNAASYASDHSGSIKKKAYGWDGFANDVLDVFAVMEVTNHHIAVGPGHPDQTEDEN